LLINCPFCYRRYAYKETLMHHVNAIHSDKDLSNFQVSAEYEGKNILPEIQKPVELYTGNDSTTNLIPGSLRLRPGQSRTHVRPDWDSPITGINNIADHRRKFKINQFKKLKLVKDGKGNGLILADLYTVY
jgi:hypothetical protein